MEFVKKYVFDIKSKMNSNIPFGKEHSQSIRNGCIDISFTR